MIAALFVEADGIYSTMPDVEAWVISFKALTPPGGGT